MALPDAQAAAAVIPAVVCVWLLALLAITWLLPNTQEFVAAYRRFHDALPGQGIVPYLLAHKRYWLLPLLVVGGLLEGLVIAMEGATTAPFIYFQF